MGSNVSTLANEGNESDILYLIVQNAIYPDHGLQAKREIALPCKYTIDIPHHVTTREHDHGRR
jgi:hypothetical protein